MHYVIGSEGSRSNEFILPLLFPNHNFRVVYFHNLKRDYVSKEAVLSEVRALNANLPEASVFKKLNEFYGFEDSSWPISVPSLLRRIYDQSCCSVEFIETDHVQPIHTLGYYAEEIKANSKTDWEVQNKSRNSRIEIIDRDGAKEKILATRYFEGSVLFRVKNDWLTFEQLVNEYSHAKFKGHLSMAQLFQFGKLAYVPWYVQQCCRSCKKYCMTEIETWFEPIYSTRLDPSFAIFRTNKSELPWGLLWDVIRQNSLRRTKDQTIWQNTVLNSEPTFLESRLSRSSVHFSKGIREKRKAAFCILNGIQQHFDWASYESQQSVATTTGVLIASTFGEKTWALLVLKNLKRTYFTGHVDRFFDLIVNEHDLLRKVAKMEWKNLSSILSKLKSEIQKNSDDQSVRNIIKDLRHFEGKWREELVVEICQFWDRVEESYRFTALKAFVLMPWFKMAFEPNHFLRSTKATSVCAVCCRGEFLQVK